jgi:DNA-binding NtrC family response regulator
MLAIPECHNNGVGPGRARNLLGRLLWGEGDNPMTAIHPVLLLVDDNEATRNAMGPMLAAAGYCVELAGNGTEARRVLDRSPVDVVLTDVFMPEEDGLELLQHCRNRHPGLPVIVMNGRIQLNFDPLPMARRFGAAAVLQIPVTAAMLLETVRDVLSKLIGPQAGLPDWNLIPVAQASAFA